MYIWGPWFPGSLSLLCSGSISPFHHYILFVCVCVCVLKKMFILGGMDPPISFMFCILSPCHLIPSLSLYIFPGGQFPGGG